MRKINPPEKEQQICLACGLCCDGTIFGFARLDPGEKGKLPELIEERVFSDGGKDFFRLPCLYFNGKCTIYTKKRAYVCGSYRCQLLRDFSEGKVVFEEALDIAKNAVGMREEIIKGFKELTGHEENITFREILAALPLTEKNSTLKESGISKSEILLARCNIFEALLIKHFRSAGDFEAMTGE